VTVKRARRVVPTHPLPVIRDANQRKPSVFNVDGDGATAGIETIFNELLYHRSGALDDLAGRNATDDIGRQDMNLPTAVGRQHGQRLLKNDAAVTGGKRRGTATII
jgi:hypothetical protein